MEGVKDRLHLEANLLVAAKDLSLGFTLPQRNILKHTAILQYFR